MRTTITTFSTLLVLAATASAAAEAPPTQLLPFYPQAGTVGQDLYIANYLDLDPGPGVRDWACGSHSYDGHTGQDSMIRSFREVRIGVPVFAALDGRVLSVQYGEGWDFNWGPTVSQFDNHVILDHGGGLETVYGHLARRSITVKKGQWIPAGTQIGLTASSGNSSWPHLHFTVRQDFDPYEPFAGPCGPARSGWTSQPVIRPDAWVADLALSAKPFVGKADLPYDEAVRTGTFVRGVRAVNVRIELRNLDAAGPGRLSVRRPDGTSAYEGLLTVTGHRAGWAKRRLRLDLSAMGRWLLTYELQGVAVTEAPFDVVASARRIVNRPPQAVTVALEPATPRPDDVVFCRVATSLVNEDPDYDIVRYRYRWTAGGRVLRQVTSAALSDALAKGRARPGETVSCEVTPSDGRRAGAAAFATTTLLQS
jgi:murein DD-endopeptidase MepM/ murein hydrolase activator NlpD